MGGSALIELTGNAGGQTITGTANSLLPNLQINTGANPVTLTNYVHVTGNYTVTSAGTFTTTGSTLILDCWSTPCVDTAGPETYNNLAVGPGSAGKINNLNSSTFNVGGLLTLGSGGYSSTLNSGTINAYNSLVISALVSGSASVQFLGTNAQTTTGSNNSPGGPMTVNITGGAGLTLASATTWNAGGQVLNVVSGPVNMAGFALTVKGLTLNGNTLTKNGGVLTVNGSVIGTGALFGGTILP